MDDHLVQIGQSHLFQGLVDGAGGLLIGLVLGGHLAGHEELLPGEPAGADTLSHAPLVAIGLGGVDGPVAHLDGVPHAAAGVLRRRLIDAVAQLRHFDAVIQSDVFHNGTSNF